MIFFSTLHSELQESIVLACYENYGRRAGFGFRYGTKFSK